MPPNQPYSDVITVWFLEITNFSQKTNHGQVLFGFSSLDFQNLKLKKVLLRFHEFLIFFENHAVMDLWSTITAWFLKAVKVWEITSQFFI